MLKTTASPLPLKAVVNYVKIEANKSALSLLIVQRLEGRDTALKIQESGENYLETILMLEQKNGTVRSIDIANELAFSKPSVSRAMSILRSAGYITMDKNNLILLTREGRQKAEAIYERHCILCRFLEDVLGISADTAATDACRIEHIISEETFDQGGDLSADQGDHQTVCREEPCARL